MPLSVSVIGDQPSSPTASACRARNTVQRTVPTLASYAPQDRVESLLSGEAGAIFFQRPTETVEVGELRLEVEGLSFYHPNMALRATPAEIIELRRRKADGEELTIQLRSQDGTKLRVYMIEKVNDTSTDPVPWGLSSISEPAGVPPAH